jgi:hypothetical protein
MNPVDALALSFAQAVVEVETDRLFGSPLGIPTHSLPNLDTMSTGELRAFHMLHDGGRNRARAYKLIGDRRKNYTTITSNLACYAENKSTAMDCRGKGDIFSAEMYENICERIYKHLPADLKWR